MRHVVSIVVPAHNEAQVIGRLLDGLLSGADPGEFEVVVVPNGCTDDTARIAGSYGDRVRVVPVAEASKAVALRAGDAAATRFPRLYVDADVELGTDDARALVSALEAPGLLAAAPERNLELADRPWQVRWYYRVWTRLPEVQRGLFGRGVIAVTAQGHERLSRLPRVIADDLAASLAFTAEERVIVHTARVTIQPPRTWGDLVRRRERAVAGVAQLEGAELGRPGGSARTSLGDLAAMARREPALVPSLVVFLTLTLVARWQARHAVRAGDYSAWPRDESSRT